MRHRIRTPLVLLATLTLGLLLYLRFRTYDLVSVGLCRVAPFSSPCSSTGAVTLQATSSDMATQRIHASRGRISLSIGSINIRYSRDAAYDSSRSMLSSFNRLLKLNARSGTRMRRICVVDGDKVVYHTLSVSDATVSRRAKLVAAGT